MTRRPSMELKMWECEREANETGYEEDTIHSIVFTAGTVLLMSSLKRFPFEQLRAWVFLIVNLILLAIIFMSVRPGCWVQSIAASEGNVEEVKNGKEKRRPCGCSREIEEGKECYKEQCWTSDVHVQNARDEEEAEEELVVKEEVLPRHSKEELNERVKLSLPCLGSIWYQMLNKLNISGSRKTQT